MMRSPGECEKFAVQSIYNNCTEKHEYIEEFVTTKLVWTIDWITHIVTK